MSDLLLYLLETDTGEQHLVRGREAAEKLSLDLVQDGEVSCVGCEAIAPGSQREGDLVWMADSGWTDGLLAEGLAAGLDIDPDNHDPYAVLCGLRSLPVASIDEHGIVRFVAPDGRALSVVVGLDDSGEPLLTLEPDAGTSLAGDEPGCYYVMREVLSC